MFYVLDTVFWGYQQCHGSVLNTAWLVVFNSQQPTDALDMPRPGYKITMMPTKELLQTKKVWISGRLYPFEQQVALIHVQEAWVHASCLVLVRRCWRRHPAPGSFVYMLWVLWVSARRKGAIATGSLPQDVIRKLGDAILFHWFVHACRTHWISQEWFISCWPQVI